MNKVIPWKKGLLIIVFITPTVLFAFYQSDEQSFNEKVKGQSVEADSLFRLYGKNKLLPAGLEAQALIALSHYPELVNVKIEFKLLEAMSPIESRPTVMSTLFRRASKRHYLVLISTQTKGWLQNITLDKMPFDAQVGGLGHELSHTTNFVSRNFFRMARVAIGNLSESYLNSFEYQTDQRAIDHGLGCNLLQWSSFVSTKRPAAYANGPERYMRPATIRKKLGDLQVKCK